MKYKRIMVTVLSWIMTLNSIWATEFSNKFSSWWTWTSKERVGKIEIEKASQKSPQGCLNFIPVPGKYSTQAYTHIEVNNKECYQLTLKLKASADINSKTVVTFFIRAKNIKKDWCSLKPVLRKDIQLVPGQTQTVSLIVNLPEMTASDVVLLVPHVAVSNLQKGKICLESLTCVRGKAPREKNIKTLSDAVAFLPDCKVIGPMPRTKWAGGGLADMIEIFEHVPLNVCVFKLEKMQKTLGFQWPDKRILLIKRQGDSWVIFKGKVGELQKCAEIKVENPELVFYGTGILLQKDGKLLASVDYGINNLDVHLFALRNSSAVKFKNINILNAFLQWRHLALAEKNLLESEKLFKDNQEYIVSSYREKQYMVTYWGMNFKTLRTQIDAKRKTIISQTGTFLPLLMQVPAVNDGYSTLIQYAGLMSVKHGYFGPFFQENWFKLFGGMPSYQYAVDLKKRCKRLVERAWRLGKVAYQKGITIKQNDTNVLVASFADSLATVFKNETFTGQYNKTFLLKLCKGEYESCQLILRAGAQDVKNISIEIGDISGPGSISKEQCRFYLMRYLRLAEPYAIGMPATGGGGNYWPDPLRSWENNKEFSIPAQSNQVLWITLQAPENAVAGEYKFDVKVKLKGIVVAQLPVEFKVFDFALGKNRLMDASGLRFSTLKEYYEGNTEARENCEKLLLEHHCNPIEIYNKSPKYEDVKFCSKNGMNMVALDRFETLAAPRKGMTKFVKLYASNDGEKFEQIPAEVKLVPQAGDIDLVDWDLVIKPESSLKDYKYIKVHNSETRSWSTRCRSRFFLIDTMAGGVLLNGVESSGAKAKNIKYYMMDKAPTVGGGAELIKKPGYFEFDDVRLNKGRASILIEKEAGTAVNAILLKGCKRSIFIPNMKKAYKKFREILGNKFTIMSFGFDEVGEQENSEVLSALKACKKLFPDVITVTTAIGIKKMPECYKYLDYICPCNSRYFNNLEKSLFEKYGTQGWIYAGGGAYYPYPNFERLDQPRINSRAFFWVCSRYDIKGWLYWDIHMWRFNTKATKKWPEIWEEWDGSWSFRTNGMGGLLYPGPNNTALPSARLEAMRDGIEDYNYFKIAEEMLSTKKFNDPEQRKEIADFVEQAKHILSPGFTGFLEKTDEFNKLRDKLASYIEKMNRLPLK